MEKDNKRTGVKQNRMKKVEIKHSGKYPEVKWKGNKEAKKKILDALEGIKEFELVWTNEVTYSVKVKARNEKEARGMFDNGEVHQTDKNIVGESFCDDSLEIYENGER